MDKIRGDYLALVERVKTENVKAASDLEKKFLKDEEDFKKKQVNFFWVGGGDLLLNLILEFTMRERERGVGGGEILLKVMTQMQ